MQRVPALILALKLAVDSDPRPGRYLLTGPRLMPRLFHYRDHNGAEVDLVLETSDGRVIGLEVKASSTPQSKDARSLGLLRDRLGSRFIGGFILHTGQTAVAFGDRITAAPIDVLWSPG